MPQQELLTRAVAALERAGVDYMLTGSLASSLQGYPRATHDIDLVVSMAEADAKLLVGDFPPPRYYLDESSVRQAIARRDMFNLLDADTGNKVDFWLLTEDEFDQCRFSRKGVESLDGAPIKVSRPEDTILMKLRWSQQSGGSEKQFQDARGVYELQRARLDQAYLRSWGIRLGVTDDLERLIREAKPL